VIGSSMLVLLNPRVFIAFTVIVCCSLAI